MQALIQINGMESKHKLEQFIGQNICKVKNIHRGSSYECEEKYQNKDH